MNYNFTERARRVLALARREAIRLRHDYVGSEHILLGLVMEGSGEKKGAAQKETEGVATVVLRNLGVPSEKVLERVEETVRKGKSKISLGELPFTTPAKQVLELGMTEARELKHSYVGTEHLLLGLLREEKGVAARVLRSLGLSAERARKEVRKVLQAMSGPGAQEDAAGSGPGMKPKFAPGLAAARAGGSSTPALDHFCKDLTALAREGDLDPTIGRVEETDRLTEILCRRRKNNPVLIGDPGVGKTAIVEGLAQRIASGDVAEALRDHRVLALDLGGMIAGTKYRGQFEERVKAVTREIGASRKTVLFIDELHTLVGAGAAEGAIDASNMLKPALARGELQCIGACTQNEYRLHVEKDSALERRFQPILVAPPTVRETIRILEGLRGHYEAHHQVAISDDALRFAARLADRYITDRALPDKAIDVIDEACARSRIASRESPPEAEALEEELSETGEEKENAIRSQDFERAASLRDRQRDLGKKLAAVREAWAEDQERRRPEIGQADVSFIVGRWTGIPVERIRQKESDRLTRMEEELHRRVVGQDEAIAAVSRAIRRSRAGLKDPNRPIGSFIFSGPTGVGKTELARTLAEFLFGDADALVRLDMSEYMARFSVSRLIGAPPGYVGYEDSGALATAVRRKPYSVVLLDEIEKAHPDIFNVLLQVLDEGRLTDNVGRVVDFKNTVLIMTSNLGARDLARPHLGFGPSGESDHVEIRGTVQAEVERAFKPEFLNRLDDLIVFHALDREHIAKIVHILLDEVRERLAEDGRSLRITDRAVDFLAERGYEPKYGARPLRRTIREYLEDLLSEKILLAEFAVGEEIGVDVAECGERLTTLEAEAVPQR